MTADSLQIYNPFKCTNGVCIEIRNILFHSLLRIVFVHNIYYIFANLSLANKTSILEQGIVHSKHRGRYTAGQRNFTERNTEV